MTRKYILELIKLIGFEEDSNMFEYYFYKEYAIDFFLNDFSFHFNNGSEWNIIDFNNLTPFEKYFKKELRSIKLKKILK